MQQEQGYDPAFDQERMLLYPLHLTSFCLWDYLADKNWYEAKQIIILSASSKTSTGLGYALKADEQAPTVIGITSQRNLEMVEQLSLYDHCLTYDTLENMDTSLPTVIVDMAGNAKVMAALHSALGDQMAFTINVGLTHWTDAMPQAGIIKERSEFFFAPSHIKKRYKDWGPDGFDQKTAAFLKTAASKTKEWLEFKKLDGLAALADIHPAVCKGEIAPNVGLIIEL